MDVMATATLRGLLARKVRLALTFVAVLLGVANVAGILVLTDTLRRSYDDVIAQTVAGVDAVVRAPGADGEAATALAGGGLTGSARPRLAEGVLETVRGIEGVAAADGVVRGYAQFVDADGDAISTGAAPTVGLSWPSTGSGPLRVLEEGGGRPPERAGEVAMDAATAREHGFEVGDQVDVLLQGPARSVEIVGLFTFGEGFELGGITFAAFDLATAQQAFVAPGLLDAVYVRAAPDVAAEELRARIAAILGPGYDVASAEEVAGEDAAVVRRVLDLFGAALLGFATVGLVVGAFVVFNTFSMLVVQRNRELGLLRAVGASGRQVVGSVVAEAGVIGLVASAAGLAAGTATTALVLRLLDRLGFDVPSTDLVVNGRTVLAAVAVGVVVTVGAAAVPAWRASRLPPVVVFGGLDSGAGRPLGRRAVLGSVIVAVGAVTILVALRAESFESAEPAARIVAVAVGALGLLGGAVTLLATFARPLAQAIGGVGPARRGITARLGRANAMRNPRRTAATASALVVGLALVCLAAIMAASTKASLAESVDGGIRADLVVSGDGLVGFSPEVAERVRQVPAVGAVASVQLGRVFVDDRSAVVAGVDARVLADVIDLDLRSGTTSGLAREGVLLHSDRADALDVGAGDTVTVSLPRLGLLATPVLGVYDQRSFIGGFPVPDAVVSSATFAGGFGETVQDSLVYATARDGDVQPAVRAVARVLADDFPNVEVQTRAEYRERQQDTVDQFLAGLVALLLLSEMISVLGIANTLLLSVHERTRELGLLRVVGMSREQVRAMVRSEAVIVAAIGAVVGIGLGVVWGWVFTLALEPLGITALAIPRLQIAGLAGLAVVAGLVAAVLPARRAARLDMLAAIAEE